MLDYLKQFFNSNPIVVSIIYYTLYLGLGQLIIMYIRQTVNEQVQKYLLHATAAFFMVGASLENSTIKRQLVVHVWYGMLGHFVVVCVLRTWYRVYAAHCSCSPNPCSVVSKLALNANSLPLTVALALIASQLVGTFLGFQSAQAFWSMELSPPHREELLRQTVSSCQSKLHVSMMVGVAIEFGGVFFEYMVNKTRLVENNTANMVTQVVAEAAVAALLHDYTGYYLNPFKAGFSSFGCQPTPASVHLIVYWVAPFFAAVIGPCIYRQITPSVAFHEHAA